VRLGPLVAVLTLGAAVSPAVGQAPTPPRLAGYLQPRFAEVGDSAVFFLNRARVGIEGVAAPWASYKLQVEVRNLGLNGTLATVTGTDLFVALHQAGWRAVAGQLKVPFSLEELTPLSTLELPDRSLIVLTQVPRRDVGFMAEWRRPGAILVQGGVFNGEGPNHASNPDKKMSYVARLVATPVHGFDVGGAVATYPDSTWWDAQAAYRRGRWSGRAEYLRRERARPADHSDGWYAQVAYLLSHNRVQFVVRAEQYDPTAAAGDQATGYTGGAQYLFSGDDLKLQASYTAYPGTGAAVTHNPLIVQMQVRW
jgi:phosphate-selective porin